MSTSTKQKYGRYKQYSINLMRYYQVPSVQKSFSLVLSIFISAFFISLAIGPTLIAITKLRQTIAESETILVQLKAKTAALQKANIVWEKIQPMQAQIEASFPSNGPDYQTITKAIEILALESGVKISSETLGKALIYSSVIDPYTGKQRTIIKMPYSMKIVGSYQQITSFFEQILKMTRVVSVENLTIDKNVSKNNNDPSALSLNLNGQIYYLANEEQLSSVLGKK